MTLDANVHVMSRARPHHPNLPDPMFYPLSLLHWIHTRKEEKNIYWYKIVKNIQNRCETERLDLISILKRFFCVAHVEEPFCHSILATGNWRAIDIFSINVVSLELLIRGWDSGKALKRWKRAFAINGNQLKLSREQRAPPTNPPLKAFTRNPYQLYHIPPPFNPRVCRTFHGVLYLYKTPIWNVL